ALRFKHKKGKWIWLESRGQPFKSPDNALKAIIISRDITFLREALQDLRETKKKLMRLNRRLKRKAEERSWELRKSEAQYRALFENTGTAMVLLEEDTTISLVNEEFERLSGYLKEEIEGKKKWPEFVVYEDYKRMIKYHYKRRIDPTSVPKRYEFRMITRSGEIRNILITIDLIPGTTTTVGSLLDITDIKKSEEQMRFLSSAVEQSSEGIIIYDFDDTILYANKAFADMLKYELSYIIKNRVFQFIPEDQEQNFKKIKSQVIQKGSYIGEFFFIKKGGSIFPTSVNCSLLYNDDKKPIAIVSAIRNISEIKTIEQNLRESEEKYRTLIETSPNSIILINYKGYIVDCNNIFENLLNLPKEEILGKRLTDLNFIPEDKIEWANMIFKEAFKGKIPGPIEYKLINRKNEEFWLNIKFARLTIGGKNFLQIVFENITEKKKAEQLIREEIQKLKLLDKMRKDLISNVSHELKTPIMSIGGATEILLSMHREQLGEGTTELIQIIERGTRRLSELVNRLIDISRIDFNKFELNLSKADLTHIIKECVDQIAFQFKQKGIRFIMKIPDKLIANVDAMRIRQVISNLLSNALKNTPPNGVVELNVEDIDNWIIFSVRDNGVGITKKEMELLFTRFGKIERYESGLEYIDVRGSGLGLFLSKEIIKLHQGEIWAESSGRNKGAIFKFKIPKNKSLND
ncbi:MAG: PAS domain-containing sensor histidine kinase, partial [Promethearchaeota archaeon]